MRIGAQESFALTVARYAIAIFCASTVLTSVPSCRQPAETPGRELLFRFIIEEPQEKFNNLEFYDETHAFTWRFASQDDLAPWQAVNLDLSKASFRGRLRVHFPSFDPSRKPYLVRPVQMDAGAIHAIQVELTRSQGDHRIRGLPKLLWCRGDEAFSKERSLSPEVVKGGNNRVETYSFQVGKHPLWDGQIALLRLDPTTTPGDTTVVRSISGVSYRTHQDRYAAALRQAWRVEFDNELRNALLAPPGHTIEREFVVPPESVLYFSYGTEPDVSAPVYFNVFGQDKTGRRQLFRDSVRPGGASSPPGWRDASVDLSGFAGRRVRLTLETQSEGLFDSMHGFPFWGSPEIWQGASRSGPPNVILISLDTLRADHLSLYGYERQTSPNLDRWARRSGVVFENAVAPSPWTLPSHASLFTGLDALRHGVNHGYPTPSSMTLVAELFRQAGYSTAAVTGGAYLSPQYGFEQGFDTFHYWPGGVGDPHELEAGIARSIDWLGTHSDRPFLLFFHTYEIHWPFRARQPFFSRFSGLDRVPSDRIRPQPIEPTPEEGFVDRRQFVKNDNSGAAKTPLSASDIFLLTSLYDAGVAYTDHHLARLFRALEELDLHRRTIVVVTSDHGEALGERGLAEHAYLYDFNLMVPLVFLLPGGQQAGHRISEQVSLVDVVPTLLELAGIRSSLRFDGTSLVPLLEGSAPSARREAWSYAASTNFGISLRISNRLKYIYNNTAWAPIHGREELYHLDADPAEEHNLTATAPEQEHLRNVVRRILEERSQGLRIHLANAGPKGFGGTLKAPFLRQVRTKSPALPCSCVAWRREGTVAFHVPPGRSFDLFLEGVGPGLLTVEAAVEGTRAPFRTRISPKKLDRPRQLVLDGSTWQETMGDVPPETGIVIQWAGDHRPSKPRPQETDPALRDQLRALGYVR